MTTLKETAKYIRSKNAGPFWLTVDIFFEDEASMEKASAVLSKETIAKVYDIPVEGVKVFCLPDLKVMKVSFPRKTVQGSQGDSDMHGGQQYIPLLSLDIE